MPVYFFGFWEEWLSGHKVVFDGPNHLIYINPEITEINVQIDLYSDWKEWALFRDNLKFAAAFRSVGGDPLPGGDFVGRTFFLINGWRILLDHGVNFTGNLFTEEGDSAFIVEEGVDLATSVVSTLPEVLAPDLSNFPTDGLAASLWGAPVNSIPTGTEITFADLITELHSGDILAVGNVINDTSDYETTTNALYTNLSEIDNFFNGLAVTIIDAGRNFSITRQIDQSFASGMFHLMSDLPFTPTVGSALVITAPHVFTRGAVA